jgi:archaea-specific DNA-binding protein
MEEQRFQKNSQETSNNAKHGARRSKPDNVVFIGKKPSMAYVLAVVTQFSEGHKEIRLKARGKAISKAVDVAEIVRNRFLKETKINSINIGTEIITGDNKESMNVSTIEIAMGK